MLLSPDRQEPVVVFDMVRRNIPIVTLVLLSLANGELLSATPPLEFFHPINFIILVSFYGSGVLIVRELCIKWEKGWGSILLLGAAYGIFEEGLAAKSFFDPNWKDVGILGSYGRWLDVNWVWTFWLTIYHTIYSIALPILILSLLFPTLKGKRLLTDKGLGVCFIVLFSVGGLAYFFLMPYRPSWILYLVTTLIVAMLFVASWKVKPEIIAPKNEEPPLGPIWFGIVGATFTVLLLYINVEMPHFVPLPLIPIFLQVLLCLSVLSFVTKYSGYARNRYHKFAFAVGLLSFLIFLTFTYEISGVFGSSIIGVCFIIFLFYLGMRIKRLCHC